MERKLKAIDILFLSKRTYHILRLHGSVLFEIYVLAVLSADIIWKYYLSIYKNKWFSSDWCNSVNVLSHKNGNTMHMSAHTIINSFKFLEILVH